MSSRDACHPERCFPAHSMLLPGPPWLLTIFCSVSCSCASSGNADDAECCVTFNAVFLHGSSVSRSPPTSQDLVKRFPHPCECQGRVWRRMVFSCTFHAVLGILAVTQYAMKCSSRSCEFEQRQRCRMLFFLHVHVSLGILRIPHGNLKRVQ